MDQTKKKKIKSSEPSNDKLFLNLLKNVREYVLGKNYKPMSCKQLREKLKIPDQHAASFRKVVRELAKEKLIVLDKGRYFAKKSHDDRVVGVLSVHARGFAFLQPEKGSIVEQDVFIPKPFTLDAVHGDTVEVQINRNAVSEKGPEGKVITVLQRGRTHLAGIIRSLDQNGCAWVYVPLLGPARAVCIDEHSEPLTVGHRVVMAVKTWGEKESPTVCALKEIMGHISDSSCDIPAAIEEFAIREQFSQEVLDEAEQIGRQVSQRDIVGRLDLRECETFTIDPATAKDFDDALSLRKDKKGHYHLGVHIADVSHYVTPGTALDREASTRCNSTYFPGRCVPMLPPNLSDHLCSLRPNVNRLTVSVMMELDRKGTVISYEMHKSVIKSQKRFTYEEAKEVLDGMRKSRHAPTLQLMVELCGLLKKQRYKRGSIEFSLPELMIVVDETGMPSGTKRIEYDITHQLVEEFMLKANELVAIHLHKEGKEAAYRVHDQPASENIRDFVQICHAFGFEIPGEPAPEDFQKLFEQAVKTPIGEYLANAYIRRMRLACYSEENIGHYGLGLEHYCHFTSPIRRYVDLVIHRSLFGEDYTNESLAAISDACSEQERISARAEQSVVMLKKLRWLTEIKKKQPFKEYEAVITRVKNFGLYFEILEVMIEGFVHISNVGSDYYIYEEAKMQLRGDRSGEILRVGEKISVLLLDADCVTLEARWDIVSNEEYHPQKRERHKRKDKRKERHKGRGKKGSR